MIRNRTFMMILVTVFVFITIDGYCGDTKIPDGRVWEYFGTSQDGEWYYNKTDITKLSNNLSVWIYQVITPDSKKEMIDHLKNSNPEFSRIVQNLHHQLIFREFNLKNRQSKTKQFLMYDEKNSILFDSTGQLNKNWGNIIPGGMDEILYEKLQLTQKKLRKN